MIQRDSRGQATVIRVLAANMSDVCAQPMLQLIQEQPDMRLVGHVQGNVELLLAVTTGVDVLILGASQVDPPPGIISHLLSEFPHLRILVIATTSGRAGLFWLGLRHRQVGSTSPTMLVNTVRQAYELNPVM